MYSCVFPLSKKPTSTFWKTVHVVSFYMLETSICSCFSSYNYPATQRGYWVAIFPYFCSVKTMQRLYKMIKTRFKFFHHGIKAESIWLSMFQCTHQLEFQRISALVLGACLKVRKAKLRLVGTIYYWRRELSWS